MFNQILQKIKEYNTIIIHRHKRADGDCIGSSFGLREFIKHNFPNKSVYSVGDELPKYLTILGEEDVVTDDLYENALVFIVDTSVQSRIADDRYLKGKFIIKIDHHDDSEDYGDLIYVDPLSPACCSIIVSMIRSWQNLNCPINAAKALFLGIVTDTGRFRYRGLTGEVLNNAAYLINLGIDTENIYTNLYIKDLEILRIQSYVLENFKVTDNGVAYIYFSKDIMEKYNITREDAGNTVNLLDCIRGSLIWLAIIEQMNPYEEDKKDLVVTPHNEIRVRIRSRYMPINHIASKYRGGGHLQASGATIYSQEEMDSLLKDLDQELLNFKKDYPDKF